MPVLGASLATSGAVGVASDLTRAPSGRVRMLPVQAGLEGLFPWGGLRRGSTVSVHGSTSLLLALLAAPTASDSWAAVVGLPDLGVLAAAELGVAVDRLALVRRPGADLPAVVAALLDGMDLVVAPRARLTDAQVRRLSARARHRGAVLLAAGPWPGADLELRCARARWHGLGDGCGRLTRREVTVQARGRGAAARPVRAVVQLPDAGGVVAGPRVLPTRSGGNPFGPVDRPSARLDTKIDPTVDDGPFADRRLVVRHLPVVEPHPVDHRHSGIDSAGTGAA